MPLGRELIFVVVKLGKQMNEMNELSGEFTNDFLHAQADAGDYLLDEEGFQYRPTQDEMKQLALEGNSLLFIDCLKGKCKYGQAAPDSRDE
jgi:hypothetical protein